VQSRGAVRLLLCCGDGRGESLSQDIESVCMVAWERGLKRSNLQGKLSSLLDCQLLILAIYYWCVLCYWLWRGGYIICCCSRVSLLN
jgi:hypothetical protein